jgi:uncharacterized protein involved in exopolysaccharide biosynthesis
MATLRDLLGPVFRYRKAALLVFVAILGASGVLALLITPEFESAMKVLVRRERMDPVISPAANAPFVGSGDVSEEELNSEAEVLRSRDLLERVVVASGMLDATPRPAGMTEAQALSAAIDELQGRLTVETIRRTRLIEARYRARDPQHAAKVLTELSKQYVETHIAIHRPPGAHAFFSAQARSFSDDRRQAEARLAAFGKKERVVSPVAERDSALSRLAALEVTLQQTQAAMAETEQRLGTLDVQLESTPSRQTTQIHTTEDSGLTATLKAKVLELELKQSDLLRKFTPDYPPVQQLQEELRRSQEALARAQSTPVKGETTDQNPTHQWLRDERVRARTERTALAARASALTRSIAEARERARHLDSARVEQEDLLRSLKTAQDGYELYRQKQEEARISDALDQTRMSNVAVVEAPTVPNVPTKSKRTAILLLGFIVALLGGAGASLVMHYLDPHFRTPDEVRSVLGVPVLATLPTGVK